MNLSFYFFFLLFIALFYDYELIVCNFSFYFTFDLKIYKKKQKILFLVSKLLCNKTSQCCTLNGCMWQDYGLNMVFNILLLCLDLFFPSFSSSSLYCLVLFKGKYYWWWSLTTTTTTATVITITITTI